MTVNYKDILDTSIDQTKIVKNEGLKIKAGGKSIGSEFCLVNIRPSDVVEYINIDKLSYDNKYRKGHIVMQGKLDNQNEECKLLNFNKCMNSDKEQLRKSSYMKTELLDNSRVSFVYHFLLGFKEDTNECYVRIAQKGTDNDNDEHFTSKEQILNFVPASSFNANASYKALIDLIEQVFSFEQKEPNLEDKLNKCAETLMKGGESIMQIDLSSSLEGYLLSKHKTSNIIFKCHKAKTMHSKLFRVNNEQQQKKVDVFFNNMEYTQIKISTDDKSFSITEETLTKNQFGDNLNQNNPILKVQAFGSSLFNYQNQHCYDLDRKQLIKSFTESSFDLGQKVNNARFGFYCVVESEADKCVVYSVKQQQNTVNWFKQNEILFKFKSNEKRGSCLDQFKAIADQSNPLEIFTVVETRYLAGAILINANNPNAKIYCFKDLKLSEVETQFKQEIIYNYFYKDLILTQQSVKCEMDSTSSFLSEIQNEKGIYFKTIDLIKQKERDYPLINQQQVLNILNVQTTNDLKQKNSRLQQEEHKYFTPIQKQSNDLKETTDNLSDKLQQNNQLSMTESNIEQKKLINPSINSHLHKNINLKSNQTQSFEHQLNNKKILLLSQRKNKSQKIRNKKKNSKKNIEIQQLLKHGNKFSKLYSLI